MRLHNICLPLLFIFGMVSIIPTDARRIRVRPHEQEEVEEDYYDANPQEEQRVVYISSADQYNGLYGQPSTESPRGHDNYIQRTSPTRAPLATKTKEKTPPVQTIRNYNKVNDDGSFTFGYEAADGSFKEETRGTDCVVRGKYGYVDPDGNKREFTYVSGNPCDPNAPKEEDPEDKPEGESNESDNFPANYPTRPVRPIPRPITPTQKPVTLFHNNYQQDEEEQPEPEQVLRQQPVQPVRPRQPEYIRPQYVNVEQELYRPRVVPVIAPSTPASVIYKHTETPLTITPRPFTVPSPRPKHPATTYRPQLVQVSVTPRPQVIYTKPHVRPTPYPLSTPSTLSVTRGSLDFDAEFQKFQTEHNIVSPTPKTLSKSTTSKYVKPTSPSQTSAAPGGQVYSSELVYDPASGQYKTQLYQTLPQTDTDISLSQRIQPYVQQQQSPQLLNFKQLQQQSPLYRTVTADRPIAPSQALYQQQQAELQFQNSAQLYAQQQRSRQQQQQQQHQQQHQQHHLQPQPQPASPQPIYYIQPSVQQAGGQIEAFLRGHNIQF